jgi:hypothetical protein
MEKGWPKGSFEHEKEVAFEKLEPQLKYIVVSTVQKD